MGPLSLEFISRSALVLDAYLNGARLILRGQSYFSALTDIIETRGRYERRQGDQKKRGSHRNPLDHRPARPCRRAEVERTKRLGSRGHRGAAQPARLGFRRIPLSGILRGGWRAQLYGRMPP